MENLVQSFYGWYKATLRNTKYRWLLIGGTLLYLVSPIDIAPDFIPLIGWIDDAAVATLLAAELTQLFLEYLNKRRGVANDSAEQLNDVDVASVEVE